MSKKMASLLMGYGIVLAGLSLLTQKLTPEFAEVTFVIGIAGGGLSVLWGIIALAGSKRRTWAVLTMIALTMASLSQVVQAWLEAAASFPARLLVTLMFLMTVTMMMYLFHGERSSEFYDGGAIRRGDSLSRSEGSKAIDAAHR